MPIKAAKSINPFYAEWRECLQAHYQHVIRVQDWVTEPTLHGVLHDTGFEESEIEALRLEVLAEMGITPEVVLDLAPVEAEVTLEVELEIAVEVVEMVMEPPTAPEAEPVIAPIPEPESPPVPRVVPPKPVKQLSLF